MENKINKINQCVDLINKSIDLLSKYDCQKSRLKFDNVSGVSDRQYVARNSYCMGGVANGFYKHIKDGLIDEGLELVVGSIQRSSDKIKELMALDASSDMDKSRAQILILDIVNCGELARRLLEQYELYKLTGKFHEPMFKKGHQEQ